MLVDRSRLDSDPGHGARADEGDRAVHQPDRPGSGLPHRQHLQHAPGRQGRRRRGQADVPLPRPAGRPAGRLPRRLRRQHPRQRAAARTAPTSASAAPIAATCGGCSLYRTLAFAGVGSDPRRRARIAVGDGDPGTRPLFDAAAEDLAVSALVGGRGRACSPRHSRCTSRGVARSVARSARSAAEMELAAACPRGGALAARLGSAGGGRDRRGDRLCAPVPSTPDRASVSAGEAVVAAVAPAARAAGRVARRHAARGSHPRRRSRPRLPVPAPPRFGPVIRGTLSRSLRRRSWALATGIIGVGLVVAFGIGLALFTATYDGAKAADSRVRRRLRPSRHAQPPEHPPPSAELRVRARGAGVAAVTPVVFKLENSVLIGPFDQDRKDLTAIDPRELRAGGGALGLVLRRPLGGRCHGGARRPIPGPARRLADGRRPVDRDGRPRRGPARARDEAPGARRPFAWSACSSNFPGFPQGTNLVANLG